MNIIKEIVKATFDSGAEKFDEIGTAFFAYYGEVITEAADIKPDDEILDIACGKGAVTFPLAEKINSKGKVYGIDISENMIMICKRNLVLKKLNNVDFFVMDAEDLKFSNEKFNTVLCGFGLFFLPDVKKGLSEIKRVLKDDGTLIFSSWNKEYDLTWLYDILAEYLPELKKTIKPENNEIHESDFRTIPGIEKILKIGGFRKISIITKNIECYYKDEEEWFESRWSAGTRMYFEKLTKSQFKDAEIKIKKMLVNYKEDNRIKITMSAFITKACKA